MKPMHRFFACLALLTATAGGSAVDAQSVYGEDFTGTATTNSWYYFGGACLTAGNAATSVAAPGPGSPPSCISILPSYYGVVGNKDQYFVGGASGYLGGTSAPSSPALQVPDPVGSGALRFTNGSVCTSGGCTYGHNQHGAIVSADPFPTGQGLQVTFKTVTYHGDSLGNGSSSVTNDGADGISFYLMDGSKPPGYGAFGGSLAYSCSNTNDDPITGYDGLTGGYIGLGIDEFGNFLNQGDNTATGYNQRAGRIGLRGAGSISWAALNAAYGTAHYSALGPLPSSSSPVPYYPDSMASTYTSFTYSCSSGTLSGTSCYTCPTNVSSYTSKTNAYLTNTPSYSSSSNSCTANYAYPTSTGTKTGSGSAPPASSQQANKSHTGPTLATQAVRQACSTGHLYNYAAANTTGGAVDEGPATLSNAANTAGILDYAAIPNAYQNLTFQIANESATTRNQATAIFYNLKITQNGLLSLAYSVNGGAYSYVIKNQSITASNGPLPSSFRFGFAGSTGGGSNVHEIMCFKAASADQSGSSATVNEKQAAKVEAGTQAYFAYYNPNNWTGTLTANNLLDNQSTGVVTVSTTANWDASCVLTGTTAATGCPATGASGPTSATPAPTSRVMLTWDTTNDVGIPFEWGSLNSTQQASLDFADVGDTSTTAQYRLNYLRGDRSQEINTSGVGLYRARDSVLGDIVDSSPSWVGPPSSPYTAAWKDRLYPSAAMPENNGSQTYLQFVAAAQTRQNVVYAGANDGFLHGFRAGSFDATGAFVANGTTPNDGQEILAYMPGTSLLSGANSTTPGGCTDNSTTGDLVQNIHGVTPSVGSTAECSNPTLDLSNSQYGHNFFVDATPGTGDLFYGGKWHTWLVGGLGFGGAAIYALDVTDPTQFAENNASSIVIGEWNPATIACSNVSGCGSNLGNTFGTPIIRRLHNGTWAVIFGNGFGSASGDGGIFIMTIDPSSAATTFYYLSTGVAGGNGIAYTTSADLDGDHVTDYVYAGDLKGNVWRFDLTSSNPSNWAVGASPLFTTQAGQPITSQLLAVANIVPGSLPRVLIEFGTGQRTQITNLSPVQYAGGTQSLYGVWDWNLSGWNTLSPGTQYVSLAATATATGLTSPYVLGYGNLQAQTLTIASANGSATGAVNGTNVTVCWQGSTTCGSGNTKYGWYANLPSANEQVIFNPVFYQGAFVVNSTVPAVNIPTSCTNNLDSGYTYALAIGNGGVFNNAFPTFLNPKTGTVLSDSIAAGVATNATGSVYVVTTAQNTSNIVYQTISGTPGAQKVNIPSNVKAKRLTWIEKR